MNCAAPSLSIFYQFMYNDCKNLEMEGAFFMLEKMTDLQFVLYVLAGISAVVLLQKIIVSLIYRHLKKRDGWAAHRQ